MPPRVKERKDHHAQASAGIQPNAEVARLQKELQLCNLRLSQMQARLMATLDELDASRNVHQLELKAERRAKERLSEKLDRYLNEVRRADAERDEMREVVSILVEKVEACNDYSAWPYARMSLARPLELHGTLRQGTRYLEPTDGDNNAVRTVLLESLHQRLEGERQAHACTKQEADAEILRLRAMVARRDAELEACATHSGHRVLLSSSLPTSLLSSNCPQHFSRSCNGREYCGCEPVTGPSRVSRSPNSNEGAEPVISLAGTRHRTLEREVAFLQGQLQQAQVHRSRTLSSDAHMTPTPRTSLPQPAVQFAVDLSHSASVAEGSRRGLAEAPPSPQMRPQDMASSPSDYVLTPANVCTPSRPESGRNSSRSRAQNVTQEEDGLVTGGGLDDLRQQIGLLSSEIDAFSAERAAVRKMLLRSRIQEPAAVPPDQSTVPDNMVVTERAAVPSSSHDSCVRESQVLREEFDALARETALREREMQAEIGLLRQALVTARAGAREPPDDDETRCAPGDPKEPIVPSPPSTRVLQSPHIPSASRAPSPIQHPAAVHDIHEARNVVNAHEDDDDDEGQGQDAEAPEAEDEVGSEMDGQSDMELATPLYPTILSLADDDLIIPPPIPPSLASSMSTSARAELEPSDIPLPISPEGALGLDFSPPLASSPTHPHPQPSSPPLILSANTGGGRAPFTPQIEPPSITSDLVARVESAAQARIAEIEREVDQVQRDLETRTRELDAKNAALTQLRATATATAPWPWLHGDAGSSGGARVPRDVEDEDDAREREQGRGGHGGGDRDRGGHEV